MAMTDAAELAHQRRSDALNRRHEWSRARLLAEMASRIAAGYAANPVTSGENDRIARWSVEIAEKILELARETVKGDI